MTEDTYIPVDMFDEEKQYWLEVFSREPEPPRLIGDLPPGGEWVEERFHLVFDQELTGPLLRMSKNNDLSLFVILLTAFKILLFRYGGAAENDVIVSSPIYNIDEVYNRGVAFRDTVTPGMTFRELLMEVKRTVSDGYKNQFFPFGKLVDLLGNEAGPLLSRYIFLLENIHNREHALDTVRRFNGELVVSARRESGGIEVEVFYDGGLYTVRGIERILRGFSRVLSGVSGDTNIRIGDIELVEPGEKKRLLFTFNQTGTPYPGDKGIHKLFEEQAARTPGNTAVCTAVDLAPIFRELDAPRVGEMTGEILSPCCFCKNPYMFESHLSFPEGNGPGYTLLKTHKHNSVVVNRNVMEFLRLLDGKRDVKTVFSILAGRSLDFRLYTMKTQDVIELSYEFNPRPEVLKGETGDLIRLFKLLYREHVIRLTDISGGKTLPGEPAETGFDETGGGEETLPLNQWLNRDKELTPAPVLFLGDTPGIQTVGLLYMASYLRRNGIPSYCQFYNTAWDRESLREHTRDLLRRCRPGVVAVSMKWFPHMARVLEICRIVKEFAAAEAGGDITVVVGGNTASYYREELIRDECVDVVVCGDGEIPLLKICRDEEDLPNCLYKKDGRVVSGAADYVEDKHNTRDIYFSHLDEIMISRWAPLPGTFFIYTHKGCGMNCFYCGGCREANTRIFNRPGMFRRHPEEVRRDIRQALPYTSTFMFDFDAPNPDLLDYCKSIWEGLDLSNHFCIFTNLLPPGAPLIRYVNQTFKYVYWNLDLASLSERHRRQLFSLGLVKPQPTDSEILAFFRECEPYANAEIRFNLIAGLPYFSEEDIHHSDRFLSKVLSRFTCCGELHWARLHAEPGAPLVRDAGEYDMYTYAATYEDFLQYSRKNLDSRYDVEYYNYPYIYYKDEAYNSRISRFYTDTNRQVEEYKAAKREKLQIIHSVTFEELNEQAEQLAGALRAAGLAPGDIAGLLMPTSGGTAAAILGVLKAGGVYLPIDPGYPPERRDYMIADSNMRILAGGAAGADIPASRFPGLTVVPLSAMGGGGVTRAGVGEGPGPAEAAYIIYTSGSTGRPKGVVVNHRGIVNYACWRIRAYEYRETDVALQLLSYCFDGFGSNFYSSLLAGGMLQLIPDSRRLDYSFVKEIIDRRGVTNISLVPSMYEALLDVAGDKGLPGLRFVVLAGEQAGAALLTRGRAGSPDALFINEYGPTEASVTAAANLDLNPENTVIIGKPIDNAVIYILDGCRRPVPVGVPGELVIGGAGVAQGYLNNPGLTAERFVRLEGRGERGEGSGPSALESGGAPPSRFSLPSPLSPLPSRFYLSGDRARWLDDGSIEFLGRLDRQIKIRGYRVETGEIENQLLLHPTVKQAVAVARRDTGGTKPAGTAGRGAFLAAYAVLAGGGAESTGEAGLKEFLARTLPEYMVPDHIILLEKIPLTATGKVDFRALPMPETGVAYVAPRDETEAALVRIWAGVLGTEPGRIGIDHNFFELGGHSLKATVQAARIHKELKVNVPLETLFQLTTIRQLSQFIMEAATVEFQSLLPVERRDYYPLSPQQRRLFLLQQMKDNFTGYNIPFAVVLEGDLDLDRIERVFRDLLKRHESFRTSFVLVGSRPVQVVHDSGNVDFSIRRYRTGNGAQVEQSEPAPVGDTPVKSIDWAPVERIFNAFVQPFDLARAPLLRVGLIQMRASLHLLMVDMHHIISDGVSMGILASEFMDLYGGKTPGPLELQYKDFSMWQNTGSRGEALAAQLSYWKQQLSGNLPVLDLPLDYPRPTVRSYEGRALSFEIEPSVVTALKTVAREQGVTLYMVLLAILNILLAKLSGREDFIVGTPVAGRRHADLQNIVGRFVNTLALRLRPRLDSALQSFLGEVKETVTAAFENQDLPFEDLVEQVPVSRDAARNPLFDVIFVLQNVDIPTLEIPGLVLSPYAVREKEVKFDLSFAGEELDGKVIFRVEYCTSLYREDSVRRFTGYFQRIARSLPGVAGREPADIEILSGQEKRRLLFDFDPGSGEDSVSLPLHRLFEEQAGRGPDKIALVGNSPRFRGEIGAGALGGPVTHLTYGELENAAGRLALRLRQQGVTAGTVVPLLAGRSVEMIIGILGILKAGGVYVPIDPNFPTDRIHFMLKDSGARMMVTAAAAAPGGRTGTVDVTETLSRAGNGKNAGTAAGGFMGDAAGGAGDASGWAYIIYTSGSTGRPKGVVVSHAGVLRVVKYPNYVDLRASDRFLQLSNVSFDGSVFDIYGALCNGAALVIPAVETVSDAAALSASIEREGITVFFVTTAMFNLLVDLAVDCFRHVRKVLFGGERVSFQHVLRALPHLGPNRMIQVYGPTETTVFATCFSVDTPEESTYMDTVPIGRPLTATAVYILDKRMRPVPEGVVGEIYIGGMGNAPGYLNRPELTEAAFLRSPFSTPGNTFAPTLYKTGDLGRRLPDGNFVFAGRIDRQVKIRGFRIEPEEVRRRLEEHPDVLEALVVAREDRGGEKFLCAYVVPRGPGGGGEETASLEDRLLEYVSRRLPHYMVPAYIVGMERFPLTPVGKVDRGLLPEPGGLTVGGGAPPAGEWETALAALWAEVLSIPGEQVYRDSDFFRLGGHSLRASLLAARVRQEFNLQLPLARIFEYPTLRALSAYIGENAGEQTPPPFEPAEKRDYYPLASPQKRLFILQQISDVGTAYNMPALFKLETPSLDIPRLREVFRRLVRRHESLRTSFFLLDREPVQVVHDAETVDVDISLYHDHAGTAGDEPVDWAPVEELITGFIQPFDLDAAPLLRVGLVEVRFDLHVMMVDMHHIVSDGMSMGILAREFMSLYGGETPADPPLQYKDFCLWQNALMQGETYEAQLSYWRRQLAGELPVLDLPLDYPRPQVRDFEGDLLTFAVEAPEVRALETLARERGLTLYMVLLAALNLLLAKLGGREDVITGTPTAGRGHGGLLEVIGMFINTVPLRLRPRGDSAAGVFLGEVKETALAAFENQDVPLEELLEQVQVTRDTGRNPLFDVMFVLQNIDFPVIELPGLKLSQLQGGPKKSKFDLSFIAGEEDGKVVFQVEYASKLFKEKSIGRFAGYFLRIVRALPGAVENRIAGIDMLSPDEKRQLLVDVNAAAFEKPLPPEVPLHLLFREQVRRAPHAVALAGPAGVHLTYDVLEQASGLLARKLRRAGLNSGGVAGLLAERSVEMYCAILGILKAGGTYMPILPSFPAERVRYMLADSCASLLVTALPDGSGIQHQYPVTTVDVLGKDVESGDELTEEADASLAAYIIYTSGTTGRPKGVVVPHSSVMRLVKEPEFAGVGPADRCAQLSAFTFDASVFDIFGSLCNGALLAVPDIRTASDPGLLTGWIKREAVTVTLCATSLFNTMVDVSVESFDHVRRVMFGGEKASPGHVARITDRIGHGRVFNVYGPTEAAVIDIYHRCGDPVDSEDKNTVPIGFPMPHVPVYILDPYMNPVPTGVVGELYLGGPAVGNGYLNKPELTAERFVRLEGRGERGEGSGPSALESGGAPPSRSSLPSPLSPLPSPLFRTGDLCRRLPDGNIVFVDRVDTQVKIRGYRVETEEISRRLVQHPGVRDAAVVLKQFPGSAPGRAGRDFLCAYLVPKTTAAEDGAAPFEPGEMMEFLSRDLPAYMIPSFFVPLVELPLTTSGKVDTRALPEPVFTTADGYTEPRDELEKELVNIWGQVLGEEPAIGIDDNFFERGGHSLNGTVMIARIHKTMGKQLNLEDVFRAPTIRAMAALLRKTGERGFRGIAPAEDMDYYPLTSGQNRLYVLQQMNPGGIAYNMPIFITLEEPPDLSRLQSVFLGLIQRHDALRTSFRDLGEAPVQVVLPMGELSFDIEVFQVDPGDASQGEVPDGAGDRVAVVVRDFIRSFDLSKAPLMRVGHVSVPGRKEMLMVDMHHIITDGVSSSVLTKDFLTLYRGGGLPGLTLQYKDYALWTKRRGREFLNAQETFWLNQFLPPPPQLNILTDFPRPSIQSFEGSIVPFQLTGRETRALRDLAQAGGATLFMVLLSILYILLSKISGQDDVVVGTPVACRRHADLENIIGIFLNTLALRNFPAAVKGFSQFMDEVRGRTAAAFDNQEYPFENLVEKTGSDRDLSRNPLFDMVFTLQQLEQETGFGSSGEGERMDDYMGRPSKFDLGLVAAEIDGVLCFDMEYAVRLFKRGTVERFTRYFRTAVSAVIENPGRILGEIEITPAAEKQLILETFNGTAVEYPSHKTVHQLFEEQVEAHPLRVALGYEGLHLSYTCLNQRINSLAHTLREQGVQRDGIVGIMADRFPEMIIGMLAILKAGAGYLPVDDTYPEQRNAFMLKDCSIDILLTQAHIAHKLPFDGQVLDLEDAELYDAPSHNPEHINAPEDSALILYTSGSTGRPKGVLLIHKGLVNVENLYIHLMEITHNDRVVLFGSPAFDASTFEMYMALYNGASLYILPRDTVYDYRRYEDYLNKHCITALLLPPVYLNNLVPERVNRIRVMVTGGARPNYATIDKWKNKTQYINAYGPTEITICCAMNKWDDSVERFATVPIGKPLYNERHYYLDPNGHISPIGVPGEVFIAGDGLARGYLNRPELTMEKFIDNPHEPGNKMYVTGDSARWLPNGMIEFMGRIDDMVKIRGFRIELGEVESHLMKHPDVTEAAVLAKENDHGEGYLCAYIFTTIDLKAVTLREHLAQSLPDYMIPSYFKFMKVEDMPLTPSDKLDRKALPDIEMTAETEYEAPDTGLEKELAGIWAEVLEVEPGKVGINDTYFELGGNSIKIIRINTRIKAQLGHDIPVADMFRYTTVSALAGYLMEKGPGEETATRGLIEDETLDEMDEAIQDTISFFEGDE